MSTRFPVVVQGDKKRQDKHLVEYGFSFVKEFEGHTYPVVQACGTIGLSCAKSRQEDEEIDELSSNISFVSLCARSLRVWDVYKEHHRICFPHSKHQFIGTIIYVPEKSTYVAAAKDLCIKFYNGALDFVGSVNLKQRAVLKMCYCALTNELITCSIDGVSTWVWKEKKVEAWDKSRGGVTKHNLEFSRKLKGCKWVRDMRLDNLAKKLFVISESCIWIFDFPGWELVDKLSNIHEQSITDCLYYSSCHYYVTSCSKGTIKVWSQPRGNSVVHTFHCHSKAVTKIELHPVEKALGLMLSCSLDCTIRVLSLESLQELYRMVLDSPINGMQTIFGMTEGLYPEPVGHIVLQTGLTVQLWKLQHVVVPYLMEQAQVTGLELKHGTEKVVVVTHDGFVRVIHASTANVCSRIIPSRQRQVLDAYWYNEQEETMYVLHSKKKIVVYNTVEDPAKEIDEWDLSTTLGVDEIHTMCTTPVGVKVPKKSLHVCVLPGSNEPTLVNYHYRFDKSITGENLLTLGTEKGTIYTLNSGGVFSSITTAHDAAIHFLGTDVTTKTLVTGTKAGEIKLWDLTNLTLLKCFPGSKSKISMTCMTVSPTTSIIYAGFEDGKSSLFTIDKGGKQLSTLEENYAHTSTITACVFNETLRVLITCSLDGMIKIWDKKKHLVREIHMHGEQIHALATLGDLSHLIIGEGDNLVLVRTGTYLTPELNELRQNILKGDRNKPAMFFSQEWKSSFTANEERKALEKLGYKVEDDQPQDAEKPKLLHETKNTHYKVEATSGQSEPKRYVARALFQNQRVRSHRTRADSSHREEVKRKYTQYLASTIRIAPPPTLNNPAKPAQPQTINCKSNNQSRKHKSGVCFTKGLLAEDQEEEPFNLSLARRQKTILGRRLSNYKPKPILKEPQTKGNSRLGGRIFVAKRPTTIPCTNVNYVNQKVLQIRPAGTTQQD